MALTPGTRVGPYEVVAPLGAGGMGEVYRARDSRLRRDVALKILPTHVASDPDRRARFEQEAHAAAALNHPNILAIYDVGSADDTSYIAAELVNGATLATSMEHGAMPIRTLLDIAVQIGDGLASAHAARIVHRDLKPANVMITSEGRIKILDFGLAKQTVVAAGTDETIATQHTVPGMIVGTVSYMSPEQACGKPVDHRSDQFSFGLMLYEMAAGKKAFDEPESVQTLAAIVSNEPSPLNARVPAPLRWIIDRCLAKNPEHRYDSSRDLYHELRNIREHLSEISTSGETAPVLLKGGLSETRDLPAWSPTGEWILVSNSLISPDGKTERSLGQHGAAYYTFSKDGKLLYGLRSEKDLQVLFSIDIATGTEHVIGSGNTFPPRNRFSPSIRLSLAPDGKSFIYGTGVIRNSSWILEGFNPPDSLAARLGFSR